MQRYQHNETLKFNYPDEWLAEYDDGLIVFENKDAPIGALQLTVFYPPEDEEVSVKNWLEDQMAEDYTGFTVTKNEHYALADAIIAEGRYWRHWAIKKGNMLLYGTYNCELKDQGKEDHIVDGIIASIF